LPPSKTDGDWTVSAPKARPGSGVDHRGGHDPGLVGRVAAAVATCRQARCSLSLLFVEIDQYDDLVISLGAAGAERLVEQLGTECRRLDHPGKVVMQSRDVQYAVILPDCDRRQAVDASNELESRMRNAVSPRDGGPAAVVTVSIGVASVALPPKNFPAAELIRAAERCLNGVRLSGGNAVKSIEIY
jgi:GGDEF domain-containing protein